MKHKILLKELFSYEISKTDLGLERVEDLLNKIGNPEKSLKCIHVAGTNGKGSVCSMIFHILKEAGCKVGLNTSPHLKRFNERIRINDKFISDNEIAEYYLKVRPFITNQSFFEITTAMAFLYFKEKKVDFAVIEVGLGGRLDATNVIKPLVSVITTIGLEHTHLLGDTIDKIAYEKAGIIKENVPVVSGAKGSALKVIKDICRERNSALFLPKKNKRIEFRDLNGEFQQRNKDIALTVVEILKRHHNLEIPNRIIIEGIKKTQWPGRLQFISKNILVDCAHNPEGFEMLRKELPLTKKRKKFRSIVMVFAAQQTKDIESMIKNISPLVSYVVFTKSNHSAAEKPENLLKIYKKINMNKEFNFKIISNPKKALSFAKKIARKKDLILVTGSMYMVGEVI